MEVSVWRHAPFALRPGNNLSIHRIGCWVRPKVTLDIFVRRKIFHVLEFETRTVQCKKYEWKTLETSEIWIFSAFLQLFYLKKKTRLCINTQRNKEQCTSAAVCRLRNHRSGEHWKHFLNLYTLRPLFRDITGLTGVGSENNTPHNSVNTTHPQKLFHIVLQ